MIRQLTLWKKCHSQGELCEAHGWVPWNVERCAYHRLKHQVHEQSRRSTQLDESESPKQDHLRTICD